MRKKSTRYFLKLNQILYLIKIKNHEKMKRIKSILESKTDNPKKVDKLLQYDCELHTELGLDSTENERQEVANISEKIIDEVIKLDPDLKYLKESRNQ